MKATRLQLIRGIALAFLLTLTYTASAFYNPTIGKWISRDPIGEGAGVIQREPLPEANEPSLYAFVANGAVNFVDFAGLWKIERAGGDKASAKPEPGDTITGLAGIIGLNAYQYRNWLSLVGPTQMPTYPNQTITQCSEFRIPNTVVAYWAGNLGWVGRWWVRWNSSTHYLEDRGFNVVKFHHQSGDNMRLQNELVSFSESKKLHGLYFWGHGNTQVLASKDGDALVEYANLRLNYKMALGLVFACDSNSGETAFMSGNGSIWKGFSGVLVPWPFAAYHPDNYIHPGDQATKK